MAVTYNIKGTTNPSFKIGKKGVVLSPADNTSETTITLPDATGTVALTSDLTSYITASSTDTLTNKTLGATTISGHLTPSANVTYDLGTSSLRFRDIYLSGTTIDLGGAKLSNDGSNNLDIKDGDGNRKTLRASSIELVDSTGKIMKLERDASSGKLKQSRKNSDGSDEGSTDTIDIVGDTSPQLGGDLDLNSNNITGTGDVNITGDGAFSGNVTVTGNLTVNGTTTTVNSTEVNVQNAFVFEGTTADDYETTLTVTDPTADRTITLPDATGTVALTSDLTSYLSGDIGFPTDLGAITGSATDHLGLGPDLGSIASGDTLVGLVKDFGIIDSYISLTELKAVVSASTDFADFKTRIASL